MVFPKVSVVQVSAVRIVHVFRHQDRGQVVKKIEQNLGKLEDDKAKWKRFSDLYEHYLQALPGSNLLPSRPKLEDHDMMNKWKAWITAAQRVSDMPKMVDLAAEAVRMVPWTGFLAEAMMSSEFGCRSGAAMVVLFGEISIQDFQSVGSV